MKIGELAKQSQTTVETIRYYETQGLIPAPPRTENNYRFYTNEHLAQLQFIRKCRSFDLSLDEIKRLLVIKNSPERSCHDADEVLNEHLRHIQTRISELKELEEQINAMYVVSCKSGSKGRDCNILKGIEKSPAKQIHHVHAGFGHQEDER